MFILGESNTKGSVKMLSDVFIDGGDKIACYAAVFLSDQSFSELPEDEKTEISSRLKDLLKDEKFKQFGDHYRICLEKMRDMLK